MLQNAYISHPNFSNVWRHFPTSCEAAKLLSAPKFHRARNPQKCYRSMQNIDEHEHGQEQQTKRVVFSVY